MKERIKEWEASGRMVGSEWNGWRGQKVQTSSYKINKSQDGMYSLVTRVSINNTLSNIWKLLRE